jgi:hypothetical protein
VGDGEDDDDESVEEIKWEGRKTGMLEEMEMVELLVLLGG